MVISPLCCGIPRAYSSTSHNGSHRESKQDGGVKRHGAAVQCKQDVDCEERLGKAKVCGL